MGLSRADREEQVQVPVQLPVGLQTAQPSAYLPRASYLQYQVSALHYYLSASLQLRAIEKRVPPTIISTVNRATSSNI